MGVAYVQNFVEKTFVDGCKTVKFVYIMHVPSKYITSWVLLSLTSTTRQISHVLLADVILWINKASLVLYNNTAPGVD